MSPNHILALQKLAHEVCVDDAVELVRDARTHIVTRALMAAGAIDRRRAEV